MVAGQASHILQLVYSVPWNKICAVGLVVRIPQAKVKVLDCFNYKARCILIFHKFFSDF